MTSFFPKRIRLCFNPLQKTRTFKMNKTKVQVQVQVLFFFFKVTMCHTRLIENTSKQNSGRTAKEKKIISRNKTFEKKNLYLEKRVLLFIVKFSVNN